MGGTMVPLSHVLLWFSLGDILLYLLQEEEDPYFG